MLFFFCTRKSTAVLNTKYYYNYSCNEPNINPTMLETWVYRWGLLSLQVKHCNNSDQKCSEPQLNSILQPHSVRLVLVLLWDAYMLVVVVVFLKDGIGCHIFKRLHDLDFLELVECISHRYNLINNSCRAKSV